MKKSNPIKKIGNGECGTVYFYRGKAIKIFPSAHAKWFQSNVKKLVGIREKMNITNDSFVFPEKLIRFNIPSSKAMGSKFDGEFIGYVMEYVDGKKLSESLDEIIITELYDAIDYAEVAVEEVTAKGINLEDLNQGSVLWDMKKKAIKFVDPDMYTIRLKYYDLLRTNFLRFGIAMANSLGFGSMSNRKFEKMD